MFFKSSSSRSQTTLFAPVGITPVPYYNTRAPIIMSISTLQQPSAINTTTYVREPQITTTMSVANSANKEPETPVDTSTIPASFNPTPPAEKKKRGRPRKNNADIPPTGTSTTNELKADSENPHSTAKTVGGSALYPEGKKKIPFSKKTLLIGAGVAVVVAVLVLKR